jgi:Zn-dependent protease
MDISVIQYIAIAIIPVLLAIIVHELAHGWVAKCFGDPTAQMLGRLTLNPIKHIDWVGTILVPAVMLMLGGFLFGWAKPVPVDARNFRNRPRDMIWVAIAGPLSNLIMAFLWAFMLKINIILFAAEQYIYVPLRYMSEIGMQINIVLMVLNILPIPPLDGSKVLMGLLPDPAARKYSRLEPFGFFIVLLLIYFGVFSALLSPVLDAFLSFAASLLRV